MNNFFISNNFIITDFQKSVNRQLIVQKHESKNIQDRLDIIISMQEKMYEKLCDHTTSVNTGEDMFENVLMCIDNDECLNEMEEKLVSDMSHRKKVVIIQFLVFNFTVTIKIYLLFLYRLKN